ncbi:MAG TPA: hypothetical protein VK589_08515, partial [Chryseolinea sp.]|nr:hypothetical protein [Chryseolinea sp.]
MKVYYQSFLEPVIKETTRTHCMMPEPSTTSKNSEITVLELRRLLHQLKDLRPDINIRMRLMGELWQVRHSRIASITETGVILNDQTNGRLILIQDLKRIMQLELDLQFQQYQP